MNKVDDHRINRYDQYWGFLEEHCITTATEYIACTLCGASPPVNNPEEILADNEISLPDLLADNRHWLARFYPFSNQPILFALAEPLISPPLDRNEHLNLAEVEPDPSEMAPVSANYYADYLGGEVGWNCKTDNFRSEILSSFSKYSQSIGTNHPNDGEEQYFQITENSEYLDDLDRNVDLGQGLWRDFYVTNLIHSASFPR